MKIFAADIIILPKITIVWCMGPEIWSATDKIFCHYGPIFALLPPYGSRKPKFWKNEKKTWRYYHFTNVYHKWQSYDLWFFRHGVQQTKFFCQFGLFFALLSPTLLTNWKIKILKNWKKPLELSSFYTSVRKSWSYDIL